MKKVGYPQIPIEFESEALDEAEDDSDDDQDLEMEEDDNESGTAVLRGRGKGTQTESEDQDEDDPEEGSQEQQKQSQRVAQKAGSDPRPAAPVEDSRGQKGQGPSPQRYFPHATGQREGSARPSAAPTESNRPSPGGLGPSDQKGRFEPTRPGRPFVRIPKGVRLKAGTEIQELLKKRDELIARGDSNGLRVIRIKLKEAGFNISDYK